MIIETLVQASQVVCDLSKMLLKQNFLTPKQQNAILRIVEANAMLKQEFGGMKNDLQAMRD